FDYVFIAGMEESIFPSEMSKYAEEDLEEERRLCYVGITRAKKELHLSSATTRMLFGQTKRNRPSRFLDEIDPALVKEEMSAVASQAKSTRERYQSQQNSYVQHGYTSQSTVQAGNAAVHSQLPPQGRASSLVARGTGVIHAGSAVSPQRAQTASAHAFKAGDKVEHKVFGYGEVLKVTPVAGDTIVEIQFDTAGIKKTMANYAPLTLVE
ncbi:MAG: 3'-5' exonuclease, partial [Ruthenibacterium sp.]